MLKSGGGSVNSVILTAWLCAVVSCTALISALLLPPGSLGCRSLSQPPVAAATGDVTGPHWSLCAKTTAVLVLWLSAVETVLSSAASATITGFVLKTDEQKPN